jgi:hypothetical protein
MKTSLSGAARSGDIFKCDNHSARFSLPLDYHKLPFSMFPSV